MRVRLLLLASILGATAGCGGSPTAPGGGPRTFPFDFAQGAQGWVGGFADYPAWNEAFYELVADYRPLLPPLPPSGALFLSGFNASGDLFLFYKGRVTGLRPAQRYRATFEVQIATYFPTGCFGFGGAPGEDTNVKTGASTVEPQPVRQPDGRYHMNIDKGKAIKPAPVQTRSPLVMSPTPSRVTGALTGRSSCDGISRRLPAVGRWRSTLTAMAPSGCSPASTRPCSGKWSSTSRSSPRPSRRSKQLWLLARA